MEISEDTNHICGSNELCDESSCPQGPQDEEETYVLSDNTLKALQEFYQEQELKNSLLNNNENSNCLVEENWEMSQFWYSEETGKTLKNVALKTAGENGRIACISCPTVFTYIMKENSKQTEDIYLFEYDKRFKDLHGEHFIYYNYNDPLNIPERFKSYFEVVLVDPPYLSEECLKKTTETIKFIAKDKIILCTGATMETLAYELLHLKPCAFRPQHERKLGNEFWCYSNFNLDEIVSKQNS